MTFKELDMKLKVVDNAVDKYFGTPWNYFCKIITPFLFGLGVPFIVYMIINWPSS